MHASNGHVPPTPYVNQMAVNQHMGTQPAWIPPRMSTERKLKGKGMYTVPPTFPMTSDPKPSNNVHFQPIDLAQKSSVQTMDQSLLNSSLNLLDDSP